MCTLGTALQVGFGASYLEFGQGERQDPGKGRNELHGDGMSLDVVGVEHGGTSAVEVGGVVEPGAVGLPLAVEDGVLSAYHNETCLRNGGFCFGRTG